MFTYTFSRKKLLRTAVIVLAVLVGAGIIIMAVMSSFKVAAADRKLPIYGVDRADNKIAVTFDCAWGNSNTDLLLGLLKDADVKATFYVTGEFCDKYPEDVKKMYDAGHEIGNHSNTHPHVEGININTLIEDTRECSRKIKMITGEEPKTYRAPYGEYDNNVISTIEGMGLKIIQWSVDSIDWQEPDPDTITKRIMEGTVSGSIILFHNDLENTAQALSEILMGLRQKGFSFAKVSDLIYYDSYHIDSRGIQIYDTAALLPAAKYSDNYLIDEAMEIFRQNLTMEEIYALTGGATPELLARTEPLLSEAQLAAIYEASFDELKEAVGNLVRVAEQEGVGGDGGAAAGTDGGASAETNITNGTDDPIETGEPVYTAGGEQSTPSTADGGESYNTPTVTTSEINIVGDVNPPASSGGNNIKGMNGGASAIVTTAPVTTPAQTAAAETVPIEITTLPETTPEQTTVPETTPEATTPAETTAVTPEARDGGISPLIK